MIYGSTYDAMAVIWSYGLKKTAPRFQSWSQRTLQHSEGLWHVVITTNRGDCFTAKRTYIRKVPDSNLCLDIGCLHWSSSWSSPIYTGRPGRVATTPSSYSILTWFKTLLRYPLSSLSSRGLPQALETYCRSKICYDQAYILCSSQFIIVLPFDALSN
jgi:hypothetical protein